MNAIKGLLKKMIADKETNSFMLRCFVEAVIDVNKEACAYCPLNVDENYCTCFGLANVLK